MKVGILGGGITACTLQRYLNHPSEILEASDRVGGLCRTMTTPMGFQYDVGGHICFSKHKYINDLVAELLGDNIRQGKRDSRILYKGQMIKYPFANGFGALFNREEVFECLMGFLEQHAENAAMTASSQCFDEPSNLKEWFYETYGKGIAERNLVPYTEKVWKTPCDQLSCDFVSRIPPPPTADVVRTALGIETEGYTEQLYFTYPKLGGFEALVRAIYDHPRQSATCNFRVKSIIWDGREWIVNSADKGGRSWVRNFDRIVVTFPIQEAIDCFRSVPNDVVTAASDLVYNSLFVVFVALDHMADMPYNALYIADPDVLTHRICPTAAYSESMVLPGTSALTAEITCRQGDGIYEAVHCDLVSRVIGDLERLGLISRKRVIEAMVSRFEYAYPVHDLRYGENIKRVRAYFDKINVPLCGRFGSFAYINSDECMNRAIELANELNKIEC